MVITLTKLHTLLAKQLGENTAENLTTYIETKIKSEVENDTKGLATKADMAELKAVLKDDIISLQRWMVGIFVALSLMILGLYATILLK
ncbi:MAG: hypothetical protein LBE36_04510 [Flavobacteriaceae bacterium]|jgi:hypothetical protein|nr:hypothetical protein [Flavobacteriaceae bacterium]